MLHFYRARHRSRVALLTAYQRCWDSQRGKLPAHEEGGDAPHASSCQLMALTRLLHVRRLCRTRGEGEAVEPFGRAVAMFL